MNVILVFTGPSGSGKTTWCNYLVQKHGFSKPKTFTTRPMRTEESPDAYHFVTQTEFMRKIEKNEMLEYVQNLGFYYGCTADSFDFKKKIAIALDHRGALALKKIKPNAKIILLQIDPAILVDRIVKRSNLDVKAQKSRVLESKEYDNFDAYDHKVDASQSMEDVSKEINKIIQDIIL